MAPTSIQNQNEPRSIEPSPAPVGPMPPEVVALICASVLIFLVFLTICIVLIRRRLRDRTQGTPQAHLPPPVASNWKEKVVLEDIFSPASISSKSCAAVPLLPPITSLSSGSTVISEDLVKELMSKTSAALSKGDKYTTLPLRRSRQARQSKIVQKNSTFDLSTSLAGLDAETVNLETSCVAAERRSHRTSLRSASATIKTYTSNSTTMPSHSEFHAYPIAMPPGTGYQSTLRPSPTIMSMEAHPLEADAAALPDAGTVFVSGSIPSFSSISSAISLPGACSPMVGSCTTTEGEANNNIRSGLDCETPRQREHRACATETRMSGTPPSPSTSVSTILTAQDTTFSSDADSVSGVGLGEVPLDAKAFKLANILSLPNVHIRLQLRPLQRHRR